jgi:hypothetical protein
VDPVAPGWSGTQAWLVGLAEGGGMVAGGVQLGVGLAALVCRSAALVLVVPAGLVCWAAVVSDPAGVVGPWVEAGSVVFGGPITGRVGGGSMLAVCLSGAATVPAAPVAALAGRMSAQQAVAAQPIAARARRPRADRPGMSNRVLKSSNPSQTPGTGSPRQGVTSDTNPSASAISTGRGLRRNGCNGYYCS